MAAKGYLTVGQVGAAVGTFLGLTLTAAQATAAENYLEDVEQAVDAYCERAWKTGPITLERHERASYWRGDLYLQNPPVHHRPARPAHGVIRATLDVVARAGDFDLGCVWHGVGIRPQQPRRRLQLGAAVAGRSGYRRNGQPARTERLRQHGVGAATGGRCVNQSGVDKAKHCQTTSKDSKSSLALTPVGQASAS